MGHPVAVVLALLVGASTGYCLARCVVPRWRSEHGAAVDLWHVLMGAAMVAMLLAPVGSTSAAVQVAGFAIAALWCACHLLARSHSGAHARLGAACAVMAAMLVPAMLVSPATAETSATSAMAHEHHHTPGMDMSGMDMSGTPAMAHSMAMPPPWLAVLMLVAVTAIAAAAVRAALRAEHGRTTSRIALACEVLMAGAMGYMAALALW